MERKKRTSRKQFEIYLNYLQNHERLRSGKLTPSDDPKDLIKIWDSLTVALNATGEGPTRESQEWKKVSG